MTSIDLSLEEKMNLDSSFLDLLQVTTAQVPYAMDHVYMRADTAASLWECDTCTIHVIMHSADDIMSFFDCNLVAGDGTIVVRLEGVRTRSISADMLKAQWIKIMLF